MAIVKPSYNVVRSAASGTVTDFKSFNPIGMKHEDTERVRHEMGRGKLKPTEGSGPQYRGVGRAMSASEKMHVAKVKREDEENELRSMTTKQRKAKKKADKITKAKEDNLSDLAVNRRIQEDKRKRLKEGTVKVRKPGVGIYTARAATAEDVDKKGKIATKSATWKADVYKKMGFTTPKKGKK